ncbi:MAG: hypothetical protein IJ364_06510 [Oscillospiraceae bacterium]|nr:hypothetical protein [Oscillospiraceae bacterium]
MKRIISVLLVLCLAVGCLSGCGKKKKQEENVSANTEQVQQESLKDKVLEVDINMENLYDYFEYKEFPTYYKEDDGTVTSVSIAYGLALKDVYTAALDSKYKHDLKLTFTADCVVNKGSYDVDFETLQVYGTTDESYMQTVSHEMQFWPKGDRTTIWSYGTYSSMFAIYMTNFAITSADGTVYLKYKYA